MHRLLFIVVAMLRNAGPRLRGDSAQEAMVDSEARVIVKYKADSKLLRKDLSSGRAADTSGRSARAACRPGAAHG